MTFNLKTLLYVFALLAVSLTVAGIWGLPLVIAILLLRMLVWWYWEYRFPVLPWCLVAIAIFAVVAKCLLPRLQGGPWPIYLHGYFRIVHIVDDLLFIAENENKSRLGDHEHAHSWRSVVWERQYRRDYPCDDFGRGINFSEPWQSAASPAILQRNLFATVEDFNSPRATTDLFAIVDPRTVWVDNRFFDFERASDPLYHTVLIIEAGGYDVPFTEPRDLAFAEAVEVLSRTIRPDRGDGHVYENGYFFRDAAFRHIVTCDGCVHRQFQPMPPDVAAAVLTASGGEQVDLDQYTTMQRKLDWGRIWSVAALVALTFLPGRWLIHSTDQMIETSNKIHSDER